MANNNSPPYIPYLHIFSIQQIRVIQFTPTLPVDCGIWN